MSKEQDPPERGHFELPNSGDLQNSEMTPLSSSEDEGWFGTIGSDLKNIATCFRNNIPPVVGGVATLVHKTAMSVAAEIAELEREGFGEDGAPDENLASILLPWETRTKDDSDQVPVYSTNKELMKDILALSRNERTFLEPFSSPDNEEESSQADQTFFVLDESRVSLIRRLLDIDDNLAAMHARMSGRNNVRETLFWKNYFFHCNELRARKYTAESLLTDTMDSNRKLPSSVDVNYETSDLTSSELDDSSLVPVSTNDDLSYVNVIPSAPNSLNTFMSTRSVDDIVLVGHEHQSK
eukprot:scaffold5517_cov135-Cylindrotheca_fusiformis.AAC.40